MTTTPPPATVAISATGAPFAGFWIRAVAFIIDCLILLVPQLLFGALIGPDAAQGINLLVAIAYYTVLQGGKWQATVGKRLLGLHVMRTSGEPITHLRALGRYFASWLSALILCIGYIMAGLTREKTTLHDLICDTRVVYGKRG